MWSAATAASPPPSASPETAWFLCLTEPTDDARSGAHLDFARAAIVSALLNAPTLSPHVIFLKTPDSTTAGPGGPASAAGRFVTWLRGAGVRVIPHNLSFFDLIPANKQRKPGGGGTGHLNVGAYCRLDVPQIVARLRPRRPRRTRLLWEELEGRGLLVCVDGAHIWNVRTTVGLACHVGRASLGLK